jgi:hypothetical protein
MTTAVGKLDRKAILKEHEEGIKQCYGEIEK